MPKPAQSKTIEDALHISLKIVLDYNSLKTSFIATVTGQKYISNCLHKLFGKISSHTSKEFIKRPVFLIPAFTQKNLLIVRGCANFAEQ